MSTFSILRTPRFPCYKMCKILALLQPWYHGIVSKMARLRLTGSPITCHSVNNFEKLLDAIDEHRGLKIQSSTQPGVY